MDVGMLDHSEVVLRRERNKLTLLSLVRVAHVRPDSGHASLYYNWGLWKIHE